MAKKKKKVKKLKRKKVKRSKKKKVVRRKKKQAIRRKKVTSVKRKKKVIKRKAQAPRLPSISLGTSRSGEAQGSREIPLAIVDHFFGHISVASFKLKAPMNVGDTIHIKGHTTDFSQKVTSMQIEHQSITKAKKGDEVGIKVTGKVRVGDVVYLSARGQALTAQPARPMPAPLFQQPQKSPPPIVKPASPTPPPQPKKPNDPYGGTKFLKF